MEGQEGSAVCDVSGGVGHTKPCDKTAVKINHHLVYNGGYVWHVYITEPGKLCTVCVIFLSMF